MCKNVMISRSKNPRLATKSGGAHILHASMQWVPKCETRETGLSCNPASGALSISKKSIAVNEDRSVAGTLNGLHYQLIHLSRGTGAI